MEKKIITMGTALALALSMGMTVSAGHHGACAGSVIRGSGLRQYRGSHEGGHHLYCYGGGQDCAYWGIDVSGVCDYWEYCHGGAAYGTQGGIGTAQGVAAEDQAPAAAPESQPGAGVAAQGQPAVSTAAEDQAPAEEAPQAQAQTVYGSYDGSTVCPYYDGTGHGCGMGQGGWNCYSGSYGGGRHGSGHHGRGHH